MPPNMSSAQARRLLGKVELLRADAMQMERRFGRALAAVDRSRRASAENLVHYLALRQHDVRALQDDLTGLGLSSLGRCEPHVLASLDAVAAALSRLAGSQPSRSRARKPRVQPNVDFETGPDRLSAHARHLFGPRPVRRSTHIMVTMPSEAADDPTLVETLLKAGMDIMRINCAHDDAPGWRRMVKNLTAARKRTRRICRVYVDLSGPKLRTGALACEPVVLKIKPERGPRGQVTRPASVWLTPADAPVMSDQPGVVTLAVEGLPPRGARLSAIYFRDTRGKKRAAVIERRTRTSLLLSVEQTIYVENGSKIVFQDADGSKQEGHVRDIPSRPTSLILQEGDRLVLTHQQTPGSPAQAATRGKRVELARIPCTLPEAFRDARRAERVFLDDGKFGGVITRVDASEIEVKIHTAPVGGGRLLPDKGINLPDSQLRVSGLTVKDRKDLAFVVRHADIVGLSFAQDPRDVLELQRLMASAGRRRPGVVLKVETRRGFEALPHLLLAGLRTPPLGVMVARGDLAVEVGFERLAEIQEEILWLCEAAHVPVIWATQVLETLAKKGTPSRAEVTDAAMSVRAECVMLNKGPFVHRAVSFLDDVLRRMQAHQNKKRTMLRRLSVAGRASSGKGGQGDDQSSAGLKAGSRRAI